jgi:hypothetical protein
VDHTSTWFGNWPTGISQAALCVIDVDSVYIAGYPSGALYSYDPTQDWAPDGTVDGNPSALGNFGTAVRYPYFVIRCEDNNRLYATGRRERDSTGSGIRYYDITGAVFGPSVTAGLEDFFPRGFLVNEDLNLLVYSGEVVPASGAPEALIITYDYDLNEVDRWTVVGGLANTGLLFPTADPEVVVGLTTDSPCLLYRFNIVTGTLLDSVNLGAVTIGGSAVRPADGSIWVDIAQDLVRIDPETLARETIVDLEISTSIFSWLGRYLYMVSGAELRYFIGGSNVANIFQPIVAPAANESGAATDFSTFGPIKTIIVSHPVAGPWPIGKQPVIVIEVNNDVTPNGSWAPLCSFQGAGVKQVVCAARWMRATVKNYPGVGAPIVNVGGTDEGCLFATLVAPADDGAGAAVDVSGLDILKTVQIGNAFTGTLDIEVSTDEAGTYWASIASFDNPGQQNMSSVARWARVRRSGVTSGDAPLVTMGAAPTA